MCLIAIIPVIEYNTLIMEVSIMEYLTATELIVSCEQYSKIRRCLVLCTLNSRISMIHGQKGMATETGESAQKKMMYALYSPLKNLY